MSAPSLLLSLAIGAPLRSDPRALDALRFERGFGFTGTPKLAVVGGETDGLTITPFEVRCERNGMCGLSVREEAPVKDDLLRCVSGCDGEDELYIVDSVLNMGSYTVVSVLDAIGKLGYLEEYARSKPTAALKSDVAALRSKIDQYADVKKQLEAKEAAENTCVPPRCMHEPEPKRRAQTPSTQHVRVRGRAKLRSELETLEAKLAEVKAKKCGLLASKCKKAKAAEVARLEGLIRGVQGVMSMVSSSDD